MPRPLKGRRPSLPSTVTSTSSHDELVAALLRPPPPILSFSSPPPILPALSSLLHLHIVHSFFVQLSSIPPSYVPAMYLFGLSSLLYTSSPSGVPSTSTVSYALTGLALRGLLPLLSTLTVAYADDTLHALLSVSNACSFLSSSSFCRFSTLALLLSRTKDMSAALVCLEVGLHHLPRSSLPVYLITISLFLYSSPAWLAAQYACLALCVAVVYVGFPKYAMKHKRPRFGRWDIAHIENTR